MIRGLMKMVAIVFKFIVFVAMLLLFVGVWTVATGIVGRAYGTLWVAALFMTALWYNVLAPSLRSKMPDGESSALVTALGWFFAPATIGGLLAVARIPALERSEANDRLASTLVLGTFGFLFCFRMLFWRPSEYVGERPKKQNEKKQPPVVKVVALIEGNICASKTVLCNACAKHMSTAVRQKPENVHDPLHAAFVRDPSYGFALQMVMRERRNAVLQYEVARTDKPLLLIDRSVVGDYAFLLWNYINGSITEEQLAIYKEAYGKTPADSLLQLLPAVASLGPVKRGTQQPPPRISICLVCTPASECKRRLAEREGVDRGTDITYLLGVSILHYMCMASMVRDERTRKLCTYHLINGCVNHDKRVNDLFTLIQADHNTCAEAVDVHCNGEPDTTELPHADNDESLRLRYVSVARSLGFRHADLNYISERAWHNTLVELLRGA